MMKTLGDTELKRLHRTWRRRTEGRVSLLLEDVQTPYNVGSIARLAAAYTVDHLYLSGATPSPTTAKAAKTALGSTRFLTWSVHEKVEGALDAARDDGYSLLGIELAEGAVPLHEVPVADDVCLLLGHEDKGLTPRAMAACDHLAFIPQLGRVGSLNVAAACGIALYEVRRRAWTGPAADG